MDVFMTAGKNILVTGAAGFIGSHLVEELVRRGANVTAVVRYNAESSIGNLRFVPPAVRNELTIYSGNIEDSDFVARVVEGQNVILHLAALIAIPYSYIAPRSYLRTNVEGTLNILEAARRYKIRRVVLTSSSEVYGTALHTPIDENHPLQGQSPYSASKIGADKIAEAYFRSFDTPVVILRPFNTFGPRQSARAFIPTIISQALECDEIRLGSLAPQRDMTFVADTVAGFILAGTVAGIEGQTINIGTGKTYAIGDFARRILQLMGVDKPIVTETARERPNNSEVMKLQADYSKAAQMLGWHPKTPLDDGLHEAINFISENRELYSPLKYTL
jgi:NAD dependent epimerase/dehydratase